MKHRFTIYIKKTYFKEKYKVIRNLSDQVLHCLPATVAQWDVRPTGDQAGNILS